MATTPRLCIGYHGGFNDSGIWLSRGGVNVFTTTAEGDFLVSSSHKSFQLIASGEMAVAAGGLATQQTYNFLEVLPSAPHIDFMCQILESPEKAYRAIPFDPLGTQPDTFACFAYSYPDRIVFNNSNTNGYATKFYWAAYLYNLGGG